MNRKKLSQKEIKEFQIRILKWYKFNKRDLPWRKTTDPYYILISEIMLQQTQAMRVTPYYDRFIKKFPTMEKLASAKKSEVLKIWSGLGFNNRAIRLKEIAERIQSDFNGRFPKTSEELLSFKGIGDYTAAAILSFAFNKNAAVIDTNIRRVLIHELQLSHNISKAQLEKIALQVLPVGKSRTWHNALMDYGALAATAKITKIKSKSTQSPFKGSEREVRGKILKLLLKNREVKNSELEILFPVGSIKTIISKMKTDKLISEANGIISIKT